MKPRLVLLHGWAANSLIWNPILDQLRSKYEVTTLDLPGYGTQVDYRGDYDIDSVVDDTLSRAPETANWVAWSLGGTIALAAALARPQRFQKLQLISTTPRFLANDQWVHGVRAALIEKLSSDFETSYSKALKKFVMLQTFLGQQNTKKYSAELSRELYDLLIQADPPSQRTLQSGLELLRQTDLRARLGELKIKTQVVAGQSDHVVPISASEYLYEQLSNGHSFVSLPGGHLPFLQQTSDYIECLEQFIPEIGTSESRSH